MYSDPKSFVISDEGSAYSTYGLEMKKNDDSYYVAGIGVGVNDTIGVGSGVVTTLPYIPPAITVSQPKPFVIIDGVVYLNFSLIKENTIK